MNSAASNQAYYDREDLKAQREMAKWTERMGQAAIAGVFLSLVGIWLVYKTWDATKTAARTSNKTYDAFIALERPHLVPQITFKHEDGKERFGIIISATNIGKTDSFKKFLKLQKAKTYEGCSDHLPWTKHVLIEAGKTECIYESWGKASTLSKGRFYAGSIRYKSPLDSSHKSHFCREVRQIIVGSGEDATIHLLDHNALTPDWPSDT